MEKLISIKFFVPGKPAAQGSKDFKGFARNGRGILVESSRELGPWRERIALAAHNAMLDSHIALFTTAVAVELGFVLPRPLSERVSYTRHATRRPDVDKLVRACLDALTGPVLADDALVVELRARKRTAERVETPGVNITVDQLPPPAGHP